MGGIMPSVRLGGVTLSLGPGILYFRILPRAGAGLVAVGCCSGLSVSDSSRLILFHIGLCSLSHTRLFSRLYELYRRGLGRSLCARGYDAFSARSDLGGGVSGGIMPSVLLGGYVLTLGPGILYLLILLRSGLVAVGRCSGLSVSPNRRLILFHIGLCPLSHTRLFSRLYELYRRGWFESSRECLPLPASAATNAFALEHRQCQRKRCLSYP